MTETTARSFEGTLEHYIVLEKKKDRKNIIWAVIAFLIFFPLFIMDIALWRDSKNFWFMLIAFGLVSAGMLWWAIDTFITTNPKKPAKEAPIYDYLVNHASEVTSIKETLVLGSDGKARMIFNLPAEHTLVSEATRLELINKYKNFRPATSTFHFKNSNNKHKQIKIPGNEAPIFAKMLHEKMPQAKFGYEPTNKNATITR